MKYRDTTRNGFSFLSKEVHQVLSLLLLVALGAMYSLQSTPWWHAPERFGDAGAYLRMAEVPLRAQTESYSSHHKERMLPSLIVYALQTVTGLSPAAVFQIVANVFFIFLIVITYLFVSSCAGTVWLTIPAVVTLILFSWPITYNLANIFQLTDLMTYLFVILLSRPLFSHRIVLFSVLSSLAILTRQNLIIIVFFGYVYLVDWKKPFAKKNVVPILYGILNGALVIWLLWFSSPNSGSTLSLFRPQNMILPPFREYFQILFRLSPFIIVSVFHIRTIVKLSVRFFPISIFGIITIVQPFLIWDRTGTDNLNRIVMQGIWPLQLVAAVILLRETRKRSRVQQALVMLSPLLVGTSHLVQSSSVLIKPLLFLPSRFRYLVEIIFGLASFPSRQKTKRVSG